jgi:hypothetical protein
MHHTVVLHLHCICCLWLRLLQVEHLLLWLRHVRVLLLLVLVLLVLLVLLLLHAHQPACAPQARARYHATGHLAPRLLGLLHVLAVVGTCCGCRRCSCCCGMEQQRQAETGVLYR